MKHLAILSLLATGFVALSTLEASAIVCARGVLWFGAGFTDRLRWRLSRGA